MKLRLRPWLFAVVAVLTAPRAYAAEVDPAARPALRSAGPEEPVPARDFLYDGNYTSWMAGLAVPRLDAPLPGLSAWGTGVRVSGRISAITQFVDAGVDLQVDRFGGSEGSLLRTELGAKLGTHPAFPMVVFNDFTNDIVSGIHGYLGASLVRSQLSGKAPVAATGMTGDSAVSWNPCVTFGVGMDIPVSPRNGNDGWWLTVRYELRWMRFGDAIPDYNLGDNQVVLQLGHRTYSNSWGRIERPFDF